jgi:hypothetical protein
MSDPRFIFNTIDYQNGANTFNNYVENQNARNNSAATGNSFQFRTDADRMKYLIGTNGKPRLSGYYDGLYASLYALTVTQDGSNVPSSNGPGGSGWGKQLWAGPINYINIEDAYLQKRTGLSDYLGIQISGYVYSPVATTIQFETLTDDGGIVYLNNSVALNAWKYQGPTISTSAVLALNPGYNPINILFFEGAVTCIFQFQYKIGAGPAQRNLLSDCFYNYRQM